ncbi:MAG TPA: glycosyltransferase family 1 protein [Terriglobales bacterium]|jgi:glycosyltransferase involved in cell wall biosynthesis|nr:glycosyltransferase family 1 protein [Terriglobales bacterium]
MMHLFINSLAASAGGGLTYIRNVLPHLAAEPNVKSTVLLNPGLKQELAVIPNVDFLEMNVAAGRRFWYEQSALPGVIRNCHADVLLSTGNFALRKSPVPQILLSRNSIYTSNHYYRDLHSRHEYRAWLDTRLRAVLAKRSARWADTTVAPSEAFAAELRRWTGRKVVAIHHGFDHDAFTRDTTPLSADVERKLQTAEGSLKLLFVSHYNYYRNFETLITALPRLRKAFGERPVKLLLTCELKAGKNPGSYRPESAARLVEDLGVSDMVIELGTVPYRQLHRLYAHADIYVTAAYTETFAHPLVEAMDSGLPVVASDLAVHREICGPAGAYFPCFSADALAEAVIQVTGSRENVASMSAAGVERAKTFSWAAHVKRILLLCHQLIDCRAVAA